MPTAAAVEPQTKPTRESFTLKQRIILFLITWAGYLLIRIIGPTLRYTVSIEEGGPPDSFPTPTIFVFWHNAIIPACWWYRRRNIAVMTSSSFDGEYIARIIERFGFPAVRGSSSRGAVRALLGMHKVLDKGHSVAFTIDGPRGPLYVAKPGPVLLARNSGVPIYCFHIALEKAWVMNSWDRFMIPKPFSRALVRVGRLMYVPADLHNSELATVHAEMQAELDRLREFAEKEMPGTEV
jgi:lysophospholipid acyltransferase (LPLAT)-like uncharacterized protein